MHVADQPIVIGALTKVVVDVVRKMAPGVDGRKVQAVALVVVLLWGIAYAVSQDVNGVAAWTEWVMQLLGGWAASVGTHEIVRKRG